MNRKLLGLLISFMIFVPLTMIAAEKPLTETDATITPTAPTEAAPFYPLIWPDGDTQWICDSIKWNASKVEDAVAALHFELKDKLDKRQEKLLTDLEIKLNELVGWLQDKTPETFKNKIIEKGEYRPGQSLFYAKEPKIRYGWQGEFYQKLGEVRGCIRQVTNDTNNWVTGSSNAYTDEQKRKINMLDTKINEFIRIPFNEDVDLICRLLRLSAALLGN
jgi:hypothetical protein